MSGPLHLTAQQCLDLGYALKGLTRLTAETGVDFSGYGMFTVVVGGSSVHVTIKDGQYVVDDRIGS